MWAGGDKPADSDEPAEGLKPEVLAAHRRKEKIDRQNRWVARGKALVQTYVISNYDTSEGLKGNNRFMY